jgi:hypothetical protein
MMNLKCFKTKIRLIFSNETDFKLSIAFAILFDKRFTIPLSLIGIAAS